MGERPRCLNIGSLCGSLHCLAVTSAKLPDPCTLAKSYTAINKKPLCVPVTEENVHWLSGLLLQGYEF